MLYLNKRAAEGQINITWVVENRAVLLDLSSVDGMTRSPSEKTRSSNYTPRKMNLANHLDKHIIYGDWAARTEKRTLSQDPSSSASRQSSVSVRRGLRTFSLAAAQRGGGESDRQPRIPQRSSNFLKISDLPLDSVPTSSQTRSSPPCRFRKTVKSQVFSCRKA